MNPVTIICRGREMLVDAENFTITDGPNTVPIVELSGRLIVEHMIENHGRKNAQLKKVVFHDPATIVFWTDGTKTVVKCQPGDTFDPLTGFLMAFFKKACGNKGNYNNALKKIVPGYGRKEDDDAT